MVYPMRAGGHVSQDAANFIHSNCQNIYIDQPTGTLKQHNTAYEMAPMMASQAALNAHPIYQKQTLQEVKKVEQLNLAAHGPNTDVPTHLNAQVSQTS